jgi:hypothetical protein
MKNKAKIYIYWLLVPLFILVLGIGASLGYRIQPDFSIRKNGEMKIIVPLKDTSLFIDNEKILTTSGDTETITLPLSVTKHRVILSRDGYFPWMKDFPVKSQQATVLAPFLVTTNATGQIITTRDPEYWTISNRVRNAEVPTAEKPKISGDVSLWAEGNTLLTKDSAGTHTIHTFKTPIIGLDFYKDRNDVALVATEQGIFALELIENAGDNKANIFPIYKGNNPLFEKTDIGYITVLDGENLMQVVIQ